MKKKTLKTLKIRKKKETIKRSSKPKKTKALSKPNIYGEFVIWMSLPEPFRKPKKQQEFAKKFKVSEQTLSAWKQRDAFWEAVEKEWNKWGKEKTSNVILAFYQKLIGEKTTADFKLWFQYFLGWSEKFEGDISGKVEIVHKYVDGKKNRSKT